MNDFTKEELEIFLEWLHYARDSACWNKYHEHPELINKIQSMIDNYCNHEYKKTLDNSGMYFINMCHKCHDRKPWRLLDGD